MQPLAKDVWHLGEPIADGGRGEKIYENLEALSGEASDRPLEGRPGSQVILVAWGDRVAASIDRKSVV